MPYYFLRNTFFILFTISGFTGLIYESIWSHYLKLFLGHAAYSQALVLTIFMGGMALGAWYAGRCSSFWKNLLIIYAIVEFVIGVFGILFHPVFQIVQDISFNNIIPALDYPALVQTFKWSVAVLLILPQSILLGMTFPLMSNGILRLYPETPGQSISMLYFTNSLGAAIGVLVSGFLLIAFVGLPGTIFFAGIINILLAIVIYRLAKDHSAPPLISKNTASENISLLFIIAAFITGMASFIYEVSWIRMLSMVLGASTHSFELMLSAFITGLAFGGLWIRKYIDKLSNPVLAAGIIQIVMGLFAILTVPLYNYTFDMMKFFMAALSKTDEGYNLYILISHFISFLVMLPTTICAGMTLPLFTRILLRQGHGEKSVSHIYSSNTLGAIAGVVLTIFIAMPVLGLKNSLILGASLDVILGIILFAKSGTRLYYRATTPLIACLPVFILISLFVDFDYIKMSSGIYRTGELRDEEQYRLLFKKDGKTSSIHVIDRSDGNVTISTNGKPDASINMDEGKMAIDEPTMVLLAAIPLSINPGLNTVANIGMGSGLTSHTLLAWPGIRRVDTVEIEPAVVEGARLFEPRVYRTFSDPRSFIHIEDAKTYFSNNQFKYDLIISEPSNPWVSGVSSLFTDEFYFQIKKYLNKNGMFVQWLQTYEINNDLILSVLKSLDNNFKYYSLYAANDGDLIIIAGNDSQIQSPDEIIFNEPEMNVELSQINFENIEDINIRFQANEQLIKPLLHIFKPVINSDYFPILDIKAPEARFKQENAYEFTRIQLSAVPLLDMLIAAHEPQYKISRNKDNFFSVSKKADTAYRLYKYLDIKDQIGENDLVYSQLDLLIRYAKTCDINITPELWIKSLLAVADVVVPFLKPGDLDKIWDSIEPACNEALNQEQKNWFVLVKALGQRDAVLIADTALLLLQKHDDLHIAQKKILFDSLMLALVTLKENEAAIKLWAQLSDEIYHDSPPLNIVMLLGMALLNSGNISTM